MSSLPRSGENSALLPHFAGLWKPTLVPDESFQTVSELVFPETPELQVLENLDNKSAPEIGSTY